MIYIITFFTHYGAVKFRREFETSIPDLKLMPVPRELSASCGICAELTSQMDFSCFTDEDVERIYLIENRAYRLLYENA